MKSLGLWNELLEVFLVLLNFKFDIILRMLSLGAKIYFKFFNYFRRNIISIIVGETADLVMEHT